MEGILTGFIIASVLWGAGVIYFVFFKQKDIRLENALLQRKLEETRIEIKTSANKVLTDSERNELHSRQGGRRVTPG